jgi:hypothetical protein
MRDDVATHSRIGASVGIDLHADIIKDVLSIGVSGQEALYWDVKDHQLHLDPSFILYGQAAIDFGAPVPPRVFESNVVHTTDQVGPPYP